MRRLAVALGLCVSMAATTSTAWAAPGLLRMRFADEPAAEQSPDNRQVQAPTSVAWPADREPSHSDEPADPVEVGADPKQSGDAPPPPRPVDAANINVAVGLSPEAPGSKSERELVTRLQRSVLDSRDPVTRVRRLRLGAGEAKRICRQRRDDLVIMVGYAAEQPEPVVLAHDCRLGVALQTRPIGAVDEPELVQVLWDEHEALVDGGMRERRFIKPLGRKARIAVVAGVALAVIGVAVGVLVASALREETVVLKVGP